ncbi:serine hydrolase domain-containing protein [Flavisolibacter tropicus]|uniref:serine hydrolase domain-containing protein n=1 Tax=Flavisolibacter tropicus TaxID=1492898 RepID=UPI0009020276|nr:serine hydrolase domain-containing protein [Flavisolibacter tropicus]
MCKKQLKAFYAISLLAFGAPYLCSGQTNTKGPVNIHHSFAGQTQTIKPIIQSDNKLKSQIDTIVQKATIPFISDTSKVGLSIGIYKNGEVHYYNYGTTQKGKQSLPTNKTVYEIGSISKTFTGTLLAQAVKDKKVKLDDDIRKYLDGNYPNLEYQGKPIKLSHLVSHISGLPFFLPDNPDLFKKPNFDTLPFTISKIQQNYSKQKFFDDLHTVQLDTIPGYKFHYSNAGAQLLKFILEKVYKMPYDKLLSEYITKPLKMQNTNSLYTKNDATLLVKGYNDKGKLMPYNPQILDAAGGIFSTTSDMLQYLKFHLDENNEVVALSHKVTMGEINDYAIGLNWQEQITSKKQKKIWQSGGTFGFSSYCVIYPESKVGIVLLTNESDPGSQHGLEGIAEEIVAQLNNVK